MSRNPVRLRIQIGPEGMSIRSEGKSPRGSVFALGQEKVLRKGSSVANYEEELAQAISRLCPQTVRVPR